MSRLKMTMVRTEAGIVTCTNKHFQLWFAAVLLNCINLMVQDDNCAKRLFLLSLNPPGPVPVVRFLAIMYIVDVEGLSDWVLSVDDDKDDDDDD